MEGRLETKGLALAGHLQTHSELCQALKNPQKLLTISQAAAHFFWHSCASEAFTFGTTKTTKTMKTATQRGMQGRCPAGRWARAESRAPDGIWDAGDGVGDPEHGEGHRALLGSFGSARRFQP